MVLDAKRFTAKEWKLVQRLNTPAKVQRFFSQMAYNREPDGATMRSFREVVKRNEAHCLEAAVGAAVILEQHGIRRCCSTSNRTIFSITCFLFSSRMGVGDPSRDRVTLAFMVVNRCIDRCETWRGVTSIRTLTSLGA